MEGFGEYMGPIRWWSGEGGGVRLCMGSRWKVKFRVERCGRTNGW